MSEGSSAREQAFLLNLEVNGEPVTFRGATIQALINDYSQEQESAPGRINFGDRNKSVIQIHADDLPDHSSGDPKKRTPQAGEDFVDKNGRHHRAKPGRRIDYFVEVECDVSQ